ncbi:Ca2+-binding RTX toxin-like protein [Microvirga lupini]|uniref:Ca2+-binding RTX toxin-like protein n=1 Tax=Microvirga lupini TaxID=420324 RepID=A0A7W4VHZ5_9HYPH|nr:calcium-binding protein [Microvirga lupini]MBB3017131.1 Ca2+-binding RTX toxin-like protein [Microvirga lupini]
MASLNSRFSFLPTLRTRKSDPVEALNAREQESAPASPLSKSLSGTPRADRLIGTSASDVLSGLGGNDLLDGRKGRDRMTGGQGNDTYIVDNARDQVIERARGGTDLVKASVHWTLGAQVENLTLTGRSALKGTGNSLANTITGNTGANILDGKAGADRLAGGKGNDTYIVDNARDRVTEKANQGIDTIQAAVNYTLGAHVENLLLTGSALFGTGNDLANRISGNALSNRLDGAAGSDTLDGGAGNDTLLGGTGADLLAGGQGDDIYEVDDAGDLVVEGTGGGTDTVRATVDYTLSGEVENLVLLGTALRGTGNAGANALTGNAGSNTLDGGAGADMMTGGAGDDTYIIDDVFDMVVEAENGGIDTVWSSTGVTLADHVEHLVLTGRAVVGTGNALANTITGTVGDNLLDGRGGADTLDGGKGNDTYVVNEAGDVVVEAEGGGTDTVRAAFDYTLGEHLEHLVLIGIAHSGTGNGLDNAITGNGQDNSLAGADGNDTLNGGAGVDTLDGGAGNDVYIVDDSGDAIVEAAGDGYDSVQASTDYVIGNNVERLTLIGAALTGTGNALDNTLTGNALNNSLVGGEGNDTLDGGVGADTLEGGTGNDVYDVDAADTIVEQEGDGAGYDTARASADYVLGLNVEHLILVGSAVSGTGNSQNNLITGNDLDNILSGADGDDTLDGGNGNDTLIGSTGQDSLIGGSGNDVYVIDAEDGDIIDEQGGDTDIDSVRTTLADYTLGARLENLVILNNTRFNVATGNSLANDITTGSNDDYLDGRGGNDTLRGGLGNDSYFVGDAGDVVVETENAGFDSIFTGIDFVLPDFVERLVLQPPTLMGLRGTGNGLDNVLTGGQWNDTLFGGDGNDRLEGGIVNGNSGQDSLIGGAGDDTYVVDLDTDVVVELVDEGTDLVLSAAANYTLSNHVENLTIVGTFGANGYGNALDNWLIGNIAGNILEGGGGNDTLDGGGGADGLRGGLGDDLYIIDTGDVLTENLDEGTDTVRANFTYTLRDNFENLELTGIGHIDGTGNAANNLIVGNSGHNILNGLGGTDTLIGGDGNDVYTVESATEVVIETFGTDTLRAGFNFGTFSQDRILTRTLLLQDDLENLTLIGGTEVVVGIGNISDNYIRGNGGNNVLDGVFGNDTLNGGAGDDILFGSQGATIFEYSDRVSVEKIRGFVPTEGDRIDLRPLRQAGLISSFDVGTERDPDNPSVFIYRIGTYGSGGSGSNGKIFLQDTPTTISNIYQYILF